MAVADARGERDGFRLPAETHVGHVRLQVSDLGRALAFYHDLLGFRLVDREAETAYHSATGQLPYHFVLTRHPHARPKPPNTTGLYHVAVRFAHRLALARAFRRLAAREWPFQGFSDHKVSEAIYLTDPDGLGLELYADRPRDDWPRQEGQIAMGTEPLDVEALLAQGAGGGAWDGVDPGTDIGHVHLHVSDLARAEAFYHVLLGLDVTQRSYPGALFLSAGGYHHHLGLNLWAGQGVPPPPPDAVGLISFALHLPDGEAWRNLLARLQAADVAVEDRLAYPHALSALVRDPDGTGVELLAGQVAN
jgi:catechol 2,3-dioxygenase